MALTIQVNGPAVIKVGPQGTASTVSTLGITENGPQLNFDYHKEGVIADTGGTSIPVDLQMMGKSCKISFSLPISDDAVLIARILSNQAGNAEGNLPALGTLIFGSNLGFRLVIASPTLAKPWRFYYCSVDSVALRPGTKYSIYDCVIDAIPYIGVAETATNTYLYDHVDG